MGQIVRHIDAQELMTIVLQHIGRLRHALMVGILARKSFELDLDGDEAAIPMLHGEIRRVQRGTWPARISSAREIPLFCRAQEAPLDEVDGEGLPMKVA